MRNRWLAAFVTLPLLACASGAAGGAFGDTSDRAEDSGGPNSPSDDAGDVPYNFDTGTGVHHDAGTHSDGGAGKHSETGPDGSAADDAAAAEAGSDDAGDGSSEAGPIVLGESCAEPIDISDGGTFPLDTCTYMNSIAASCGTTAAAAILRGVAPTIGSTYSITFPSGWVLQELDDTCTPMTDSCGSTGTWGVSGAGPWSYWYFAIEPASGTCGSTSVVVDRLM